MQSIFKKEDFDRTVFIVNDHTWAIEEHVLRDLCLDYATTRCTPRGVAPAFHTRGNEVWEWLPGGKAELFMEHETEDEAEQALMEGHLYDLKHGADENPIFYDSREEAEEWVRQAKEELENTETEE